MTLIELDNRILQIIIALQFTADETVKDKLLDELATLQVLADTDETTMN